MRNATLRSIFILLGVLASPAFADVFVADGAGPSLQTAEDLSHAPVTGIIGDFGLNSNDPAVNMFKIDIAQPGLFSAISLFTGAFGVPDPELFLFNSQGFGVYFNDDISSGNTQSCLPSSLALTSPCAPVAGLGPVSKGIYYLAITYSANGALDANGNEIFTNVQSTDVVGPNAGAGPLAGWDGNIFTQPNSDLTGYDIQISGAAVPEPSSLLPSVLILVSMVVFGRKWRIRTNSRA
jgi:hypothetical protein